MDSIFIDELLHVAEPRVLVYVPPQIEVLWRLLFEERSSTQNAKEAKATNNNSNANPHQHKGNGGDGGAADFVDVVAALIVAVVKLEPQQKQKQQLLTDHATHSSSGSNANAKEAELHSSPSLSLLPSPTQIALRELILELKLETIDGEEVGLLATCVCFIRYPFFSALADFSTVNKPFKQKSTTMMCDLYSIRLASNL